MADGFLPEVNSGARSGARESLRDWPLWVLMAVDWCMGLWLLPRLPNPVPLHWGLSGRADGWGSPISLVVLFPTLALVLYLCLQIRGRMGLDVLSGFRLSEPLKRQFRWLAVSLLCGVHLALLWNALGCSRTLPRLPFLGFGLAMVFIGNLLPRMEPSLTTAPTPERREAWRHIYRRAGRALVLAGVFQAATAGLPAKMLVVTFLGSLLLTSLVPMFSLIRLKAYRPHAGGSLQDPRSASLWGWPDFLALAGLGSLVAVHRGLPMWLGVGLPVSMWCLLWLESALLPAGEVRRVAVHLRGWVILSGELALGSHALTAFGQLWPILTGLTAMTLGPAVGQAMARQSASLEARAEWGEGPVLFDVQDPRLFAPKGLGFGWTFNFARVSAWILLIGMLAFAFWIANHPNT